MNSPSDYPTIWHKKVLWRAVAALSIAVIFAISVGFIYVFTWVVAKLQPILVPFAVAGVMAYLLEPFVGRLVRMGTTRHRAVGAVFAITTLVFAGLLVWIIPIVSTQSSKLAHKLPGMMNKMRLGVYGFAVDVSKKWQVNIFPPEVMSALPPKKKITDPIAARESGAAHAGLAAVGLIHSFAANSGFVETSTALAEATALFTAIAQAEKDAEKKKTPPNVAVEPAAPATPEKAADTVEKKPEGPDTLPASAPNPAAPAHAEVTETLDNIASGEWLREALPGIATNVWKFLSTSLGGFLGFFGFILSFFIVPFYLFYFLTESKNIASGWAAYVPLKKSEFKDEVVSCLTEINGYLIAFFRGQLVVSMINGVATGFLLAAVGLDFGILIGFALCFLGIVPYLGIVLCWIPAVIVASVQGGSWLVPADAAWWVFPVIVTALFAVVQQVDGLFITPKIVGESVGLHPVTVIFSVFLWSAMLGGLLGAILAVPLTATLKVLLKRYVWERAVGSPLPSPA